MKYDFMPSLLEIIERPAHKAGTVIILGVFTLLIAAVIWACLSKIDVVVTAGGSVQPSGNVNVVQAYSGGTVKSIKTATIFQRLKLKITKLSLNRIFSQLWMQTQAIITLLTVLRRIRKTPI